MFEWIKRNLSRKVDSPKSEPEPSHPPPLLDPVLTLSGHAKGGCLVAIPADGNIIVSAVYSTVKTWDGTSGRELLTFKSPSWGLAISMDGKLIVTGGERGDVKVWDATTGRERHTLKGHTADVFEVAISADNRRIATVSRDQTVKVWDTASGHEVLTFKGHADNRMLHMSVAFFPDGKRIVSGGDGYQIAAKLWDATTGD